MNIDPPANMAFSPDMLQTYHDLTAQDLCGFDVTALFEQCKQEERGKMLSWLREACERANVPRDIFFRVAQMFDRFLEQDYLQGVHEYTRCSNSSFGSSPGGICNDGGIASSPVREYAAPAANGMPPMGQQQVLSHNLDGNAMNSNLVLHPYTGDGGEMNFVSMSGLDDCGNNGNTLPVAGMIMGNNNLGNNTNNAMGLQHHKNTNGGLMGANTNNSSLAMSFSATGDMGPSHQHGNQPMEQHYGNNGMMPNGKMMGNEEAKFLCRSRMSISSVSTASSPTQSRTMWNPYTNTQLVLYLLACVSLVLKMELRKYYNKYFEKVLMEGQFFARKKDIQGMEWKIIKTLKFNTSTPVLVDFMDYFDYYFQRKAKKTYMMDLVLTYPQVLYSHKMLSVGAALWFLSHKRSPIMNEIYLELHKIVGELDATLDLRKAVHDLKDAFFDNPRSIRTRTQKSSSETPQS